MSLIPAFRRYVVEPAWARWTGTPLLKAWRELERTQLLPASALRERQWARLEELVHFVLANNEFHRQRLLRCGIGAGALSTGEFRRVPLLTKAEVRAQGTALLSEGFEAERLVRAKTGGSTGKPLEVYFTEEVSELRNACGRRHRRWSGWDVGEPIAAVWGNPHYPDTLPAKAKEWLLSPVIYLDTMSVSVEAVRRFARDWSRVRPTLIFGHAHSIYLLADMVRRLDIDDIRPRAIIASSMMLSPWERAAIEGVFGVRVFDMYGCEEFGLIASECERHEGLHVNSDQLLVEILREDGSAAGPGESGHVVVTDLQNLAMPLIRYRMEDMAETARASCSCGRGLPMIRKVTGRVADFLRRQDGSRVAGVSLIENTLTRMPGIEQMQIVQETLGLIRLRVVPSTSFGCGARAQLVDYFTETFPGTTVDLEEVREIKPEPSGKYRFSICNVTD